MITSLSRRGSLVTTFSAFCAALLLAGCTAEGQKQNVSRIRVLNAVFESPAVKVSVPEKELTAGLGYGVATPYTEVTSGVLPVTVSSTAGAKLFESTFSFGNERPATVVVAGIPGNYGILVFDDVVSPPQEGRVRARVMHAASTVPALDAYLTLPGESIDNIFPTYSVSLGILTTFAEFNAGSYVLRLTLSGTKEVVYESDPIAMASRATLSLMAISSGSQRMASVARLNHDEAGAVTQIPSKLARVRVANAVAATPLNVLIDGTQVAENVAAGALSTGLNVAAGARTFRIDANATPGTALSTATLNLNPGREYTVLAMGSGTAATLTALADNTQSANSATKIRLRVVNGVVGGEDAVLKVGTTTLSTVPKGTAGAFFEQDIGTLAITVTGATSGASLYTAAAQEFLVTDVGKRYSVLLAGTPGAVTATLVSE